MDNNNNNNNSVPRPSPNVASSSFSVPSIQIRSSVFLFPPTLLITFPSNPNFPISVDPFLQMFAFGRAPSIHSPLHPFNCHFGHKIRCMKKGRRNFDFPSKMNIFWPGPLLIFVFSSIIGSITAPMPWAQFSAGPSKRSQGCDDPQWVISAADCVCLGTENGRTVISVDGLSHYSRLSKSFVRCRRIIGNLEITHIDQADLDKAQREWQRKQKRRNGTFKGNDGPLERPFQFLEDLEEITGYLLIFNVNLTELMLPKLRVIWGEKLHDGNALQIDSNPNMAVLNLPSLRTIEEGKLAIKRSPYLCYMNWRRGQKYVVDMSEILSVNLDHRLELSTFSRRCRQALPCHQSCNGNCFGPVQDQCQTIYRKNCHQSCESKACFVDEKGTSRCCDEACAGGCFDQGRDKCVACKRFEEDGKCVGQCRGTHAYNPNTLEREELAKHERRFAYGRHCVQECPPGSLVEDEHCVSRCSIGKYRNAQIDDGHCVPCPEGKCPRVCQLNEPLNAVNIQKLTNCSEIEGSIEILGHAFQEHMPHGVAPIPGSMPITIPALNATQLEVLKSVRIVTGYVVLDGAKVASRAKPRSLGFLENLEVIEGRRLYYEKYALYIIGNPDLKWLGLRSLLRIKNGLVSVQRNEKLCYGYSIPFGRALGVRESLWKENMEPTKCEKHRRKCDVNCNKEMGCWGPGSKQCFECKNYSRDGECVEECPKFGYFVPKSMPNQCHRCHEQCRTCRGLLATDCAECLNFELWIDEKEAVGGEERIFADNSKGAIQKCVAQCPNGTFVEQSANSTVRCQPCHPACQDGCTGPNAVVGPGGCNKCNFALTCLLGEEPVNAVCGERNGLPIGYFLGLEPYSALSKFICRKCRPECISCTRDGTATDICECAHWDLADWNGNNFEGSECLMECGKGSRILAPNNKSLADGQIGKCQRCHPLCDPHLSCAGQAPDQCDRCANGGIGTENGTILCLEDCPAEFPFKDDLGICQSVDPERMKRRRHLTIGVGILVALLILAIFIGFLIYRCLIYQKKYIKEVQMHLPEIPPLDPMKVTQRPNMRRLNLIQINELDFAPGKSTILGHGAFGIVYAGKWRPPCAKLKVNIPVAIKAINHQQESGEMNEREMLNEAGLMHSVQHEHLLPVAGICLCGGGIKIVTLLRPLGSLLQFLQQYKEQLSSKQLMLYCYQISSAMEYLAKRHIVHRDLAARNVLVKNAVHVEVTDFGLAKMLPGADESVVVEGKVAAKWMAPESLRWKVFDELTDVWSFGVTCWEILTLGGVPYKNVDLNKGCLASDLVKKLEAGLRLPMDNMSIELQKELIKCWMIRPKGRPHFQHIKATFEQFCRAPHLCIQRREANQRKMESISNQDQQAMIARLLQDSDFLDPLNLNPAEYCSSNNNSSVKVVAATNEIGRSSPETATTNDCFFPPSSANGSTKSRSSPPSPPGPGKLRMKEGGRHGSTGTASTRYKSDPVSRKWSQPWTDESGVRRTTDEEENYLVPKRGAGLEGLGEENDEEVGEEDYTQVVDEMATNDKDHKPNEGRAIYANQREYMNGNGDENDLIRLSMEENGNGSTIGYMNTVEKTVMR